MITLGNNGESRRGQLLPDVSVTMAQGNCVISAQSWSGDE